MLPFPKAAERQQVMAPSAGHWLMTMARGWLSSVLKETVSPPPHALFVKANGDNPTPVHVLLQ